MRKIRMIDVSRLRETFHYEPLTGNLFRRGADKPCGMKFTTGHLQVSFDNKMIGVHRVAWAILYGEYPNCEIDHINSDPSDNRICNLRKATSSQNNQNRRLSRRNKSGVKGVFRIRQNSKSPKLVWRVAVGHSCGKYHIKDFECFGRAIMHARAMRIKLHGDFANFGVA